jgi:hypothetical protein
LAWPTLLSLEMPALLNAASRLPGYATRTCSLTVCVAPPGIVSVAVTQLKPNGADELALTVSGSVPLPFGGTEIVPFDGETARPLPAGAETST